MGHPPRSGAGARFTLAAAALLVISVTATNRGGPDAGGVAVAPAAASPASSRLDSFLLDDQAPAGFGPTRETEAAIRATARPSTTAAGSGQVGGGGGHRSVH